MASFDAYLQIEGIPGEAQDDKHKEWIEILSYSGGVSQATSQSRGSAGGASTGRADFSDFSAMKFLDKASPKLAEACATGKHIKKVKMEVCRAGGDKLKFYEVTMEDVMISSYQVSGSGGGDGLPTESLSLNFAKIEWVYTQQKRTDGSGGGNVTAKFDLAAGKS